MHNSLQRCPNHDDDQQQNLVNHRLQIKNKVQLINPQKISIPIISILSIIIISIYMSMRSQQSEAFNTRVIKTTKSIKFDQKNNISQIISLYNTNQQIYPYTCNDAWPMFDYFHLQNERLYFRTSYGIFFQVTQFGRVDFQKWNNQRQIIQWSRKNLHKGQKVYYDCPDRQNLLQIVMISKFIGENGIIVVNNWNKYRQYALKSIQQMYNISNIRLISDPNPYYQKYNIIITTNQIHLQKLISNGMLQRKISFKIFAYLNSLSRITPFLSKMQQNKQLQLSQILIDKQQCNHKIYSKKSSQVKGFYEFKKGLIQANLNKQQQQQFNTINQHNQSPFIKLMQSLYKQYNISRPSLKQNKQIDKILQNLPIPSTKLINRFTKQQLTKWENQKQVIEWVKNRTSVNSTVYYQYKQLKDQMVNVLVVINIAKILSNGQVILVCTQNQWKILSQQVNRLNIRSLKHLRQSSLQSALNSNFIITNNLNIISQCISNHYTSHNNKILGYFTQSIPQSIQLLYKSYTNQHIQHVTITQSHYFGYEIFSHFAWHSNHPEGFFQIQKQDYVIYSYWGDQPEKLTGNRKYSVEQAIRNDGVQFKLIYSKLIQYFQLKQSPLHKSYEYLSPVHKSDYIRVYLMYNYGGGYHDIKHVHFNWKPYFQKLYSSQSQNKWAIGYHQRHPQWPTCHEQPNQTPCDQIKKHYLNIMGAGQYIHKRKSPLTTYWLNRVTNILDSKYQHLKQYPAITPRDYIGREYQQNGQKKVSKYPLRWEQINAQVFCRAQYSVLGQYYVDLPYVIVFDYT